ncbi:DUF5412 family protein [Bacillus sp. PS06]|uniref:DUF5412 family protein n=1 Tax=Bacillus sp. PS06 TaxID=2764176 RepID=UPI00177D73F0|nr:DUF5412 family protein [Bacillus sp. PS06]MBD8068078.1 hypothetical protein [Bacillus sp. PS06]
MFIITSLLILVFIFKLIIFFFKKKHFPKKLLLVSLLSVIILLGLSVYKNYFFTFNSIDRSSIQIGPGPVLSPTEAYTANAYYEPYGGAAGGVNVWVEITYNHEDKPVKTVYYSDAKTNFSMKWLDEETIYIVNDEPKYPTSNRSIKLVIGKEIYHENGLACKSLLMKDEYENCYQTKLSDCTILVSNNRLILL